MDKSIVPGAVLLGKYRVERVLGQGGMGIVVAARHMELGQLQAIKFLLPEMLAHPEIVERFLREARAAAKLQSDHVVRVSDVGRLENGAPFMVMEYLEGRDLKALVAREGPLSVDVAVTYILQVCDAIAEAHGAGIIHRDLKPANLFLVRRRGRLPCVKVLDFGISKQTGRDDVDLTNTNMSLGSPLYMSPEQMSRVRTVDRRTDIWAIGVILYELLVGESPFRGSTLLEVAAKVLQEQPRPLRDVRPDVPEGLVDVVTRCLRKRREERFASIEELIVALQPFVSGDVAARLPMISATNIEETSETPPASNDEAQTIRVERSSPSTSAPAGDPTALTFGQTEKARRLSRPVVPFAVVGVLLSCGVVAGAGWYASTTALSAPDTSMVAASPSRLKPDSSVEVVVHSVASTVPEATVVVDVEPVRVDEPAQKTAGVVTATTQDKPVATMGQPKPQVNAAKAPALTTTHAPAPAPTPRNTRPGTPD